MENIDQNAVVIYISPAGTTRHVAKVIYETLNDYGVKTVIIDLGIKENCLQILTDLKGLLQNACLWIGSPVYFGHAVPPVVEFIAKLPTAKKGYAVPFVTFGGVTSGITLYEMGKMLLEKGADVSIAINGTNKDDGKTALSYAREHGHVEIVKVLSEK